LAGKDLARNALRFPNPVQRPLAMNTLDRLSHRHVLAQVNTEIDRRGFTKPAVGGLWKAAEDFSLLPPMA
jgi:hypothetical protein